MDVHTYVHLVYTDITCMYVRAILQLFQALSALRYIVMGANIPGC